LRSSGLSCQTALHSKPRRVEEGAISELARVYVFEHLDPNELDQLEALAQKKQYPANTVIFFQDDPADAMYILLGGSAKVFQTSEDGKDRILRILKRGDLFGELAMMEGKPRFVSVQTTEPCDVLVINRKDLVAFGDKHTWLLWKLLAALAERIRRRNEDVLEMSYRDAPYRLLRALSELIQDHGEAAAGGRRFTMQMSVRDLASMIGSNNDTVGHLLDRFENDGLIKRDGGVWTVPDPQALTRTVEYAAQQES
jgi:CRP-like cAMP-binding protein